MLGLVAGVCACSCALILFVCLLASAFHAHTHTHPTTHIQVPAPDEELPEVPAPPPAPAAPADQVVAVEKGPNSSSHPEMWRKMMADHKKGKSKDVIQSFEKDRLCLFKAFLDKGGNWEQIKVEMTRQSIQESTGIQGYSALKSKDVYGRYNTKEAADKVWGRVYV